MHHTSFKSLVAAGLILSATGQHVPESRLRGTPVGASITPSAVPSNGNYNLSKPSGTLRFTGNFSSVSFENSTDNWHLKYPEYASTKTVSMKKRIGEVQFATFGVVGYREAVRIDRGNVNARDASYFGQMMETVFVFQGDRDGDLRVVRTKPWDEGTPAYQGVAPASELCSIDEKVYKEKKDPDCDYLTFPKTSFDLLSWNLGFEDSQTSQTRWAETQSSYRKKKKVSFGPTLGYPFNGCFGFYGDDMGRLNDTKIEDGVTVGHWGGLVSSIGHEDSASWSIRLDGKWKGFPTAFEHSWSYQEFEGMSGQQVSIEAAVEPYELKATNGKMLKTEELFPKNAHFPKCEGK